jgi:ketosteroid isomerase-like protein
MMKPEQSPITGQEDRSKLTAPLRALSDFYDAFNSRNLEKMSQSWAQIEDIAMDNPLGGIKRGWEEIRAVYERIFSGPAKVHVEFYDYTSHEAKDIFYAVGRERGEFRVGDTVIPLTIRTTRIFRMIAGHWRQVHHHGSIDDPDLLARYRAAVRGAVERT